MRGWALGPLVCVVLTPGQGAAGDGSKAVSDGRLRVEYVGKGQDGRPAADIRLRLRLTRTGQIQAGPDTPWVVADKDLRALLAEAAAGRGEVVVALDLFDPAGTTVETLSKGIDRLAAALPAKIKMTVVVRD